MEGGGVNWVDGHPPTSLEDEMVSIGVKNISKKKYVGVYDGNPYEFKIGEMRILDSEIAVHLVTNSNLAAIGGQALKLVKMEDIPEELRKSPDTAIDTLMGVENKTGKTVDVMFDGRFYSFPKGYVAYYPKSIAEELINRSREGDVAVLTKAESKPAADEQAKEEKEVKEVKKEKKSK